MIDELAVGVSRLRDQSYAIGDETNLQLNLLDETESNLDGAYEQLGGVERRVTRLYNETSIWKLQLIVAGLSISFFVLLVLRIV
jgi:hypothetical protein